jgi:hypothetical protein
MYRIVRISNSIQKVGEVFGTENDEKAIEVEVNSGLSECIVDGVPVTTTRRDGLFLEHYSNALQESVGISKATDDTVIEHRDNSNRFVGADIYEGAFVRHIDKDRNLAGITKLRHGPIHANTARVVIEDDSYLRTELEKAAVEYRRTLGSTLAYESAMREIQAECLNRSDIRDCADLATRAQNALYHLEERFSNYS